MKTTVVYHNADFDGLFCRETARKFLPDAALIGWDFGDPPLPPETPIQHQVYVLDLPLDKPFGLSGSSAILKACHSKTIWIDHHKSAIDSHPRDIPGYRIDGVAACRLAWQWFTARLYLENSPRGDNPIQDLPIKSDFVERRVSEPLAVRLAGEYDIWDRRDPRAELFQDGLRGQSMTPVIWSALLCGGDENSFVDAILERGSAVQYAKTQENADIISHYGFTVVFEGLTFLACNHARYNSFLFTAGLKPEHDACLGFKWNGQGKKWEISMYHAPGKEHHDLSLIAAKHGGGGHKGACGFVCKELPFRLE